LSQRGEGRTIFVTGAASGIGRATSRLFSERGWAVGLFDRDADAVETVAAELASESTVSGFLDVTDPGSFERAVKLFSDRWGARMDVLFQSAGLMRMGRFEAVPLEERLLEIRVNAIGVVIGISASLDLLRRTPGSRIVTMGSASAFHGIPELSTYSASKFFVAGLTEALSLELKGEGVTVSDIQPLWVDTPMVRNQPQPASSFRRLGARGTPEEIAELVWRAAHGERVHWIPGFSLRIVRRLGLAFPALGRRIVRYLARAE